MKLKYMNFRVCLVLFLTASVTMNTFAQTAKPKKLDGIAAVIGDQIVLESDVERDFILSTQQGLQVNDKCEFLNDILMEKMLIDRAKQDTLISVTQDEITRALNGQIEDFKQRGGGEEQVLKFFGFRTMAEMKNEIKYVVEDNIFSRRKRESIVSGLDATPEEVRVFFDKNKAELPDVKEEITLSHIMMYPEVSQENEDKIINELKNIKKEIEEGASFATKAILYSEDPGSANNGGLYLKVTRGKMVKEFDAVAFNLEEGEISDPFKTEFGYHIIKLDKRRGQELDLRHILMSLKPTEEELKMTIDKLDSIRVLINEGTMTFKDAAARFSDDKFTKYNDGNLMSPQSGEDRFEKINLAINEFSAVAGLSEGDLTSVFADEYQNKKVVRLMRVNRIFPEHKINYEDDYYRIKQFAVRYKEQDVLVEWVKKQIPNSFIKIGDDYKSCKFPIKWDQN
ncbi:peptidylprolyl isomerase [Faecalibacter sp. WQ 117]|uniref:Peptidylprolyl isomerase n=2 Tax=Faecalibacter rhinopitheci TaxID=2779678 RepID=A0A8J7K338_9FLAO|nr:peptidylprolyl isomerase [Faecalibacter rhinopitheci]MBQ0147034.1 peptidylprolyl isomerase [Candidatus Onthonaster equi]